MLDLPAFIDFVLLNLYGANADWDRGSNWYAGRRRTPSGPWRFFEWDGERTLETVTDNRLGTDDDESPMRLFQRLRGYAPFVQAFAARAKIVLGEGGPLSPVPAAARYQKLADGLGPAIAAEAARWGAYRREVAPVVYANSLAVAGVWDGFDPDWLHDAARRNAAHLGLGIRITSRARPLILVCAPPARG